MPAAGVSRIVTVYHQWGFLRDWAWEPALFNGRVEWIVVNDAPGDPAPRDLSERLEALGVRVITPRRNLGRSGARNLGAQAATGVWLDFVDGDDRPLPFDAPAEVVPLELVFHPVPERRERVFRPEHGSWPTPWDSGTHTYWGFLAPEWRPCDPRPAGVLWRREAFLELGGFDGRFEPSEDLHLLACAQEAGLRAGHDARPKQAYFWHEAVDFRAQADPFGPLRFLRWRRERAEGRLRTQLTWLLGRQVLACGLKALRDSVGPEPSVRAYLRARFSGEFGRFNR
jgi:glycosyltransferase involved in cell wall biosynthesis